MKSEYDDWIQHPHKKPVIRNPLRIFSHFLYYGFLNVFSPGLCRFSGLAKFLLAQFSYPALPHQKIPFPHACHDN